MARQAQGEALTQLCREAPTDVVRALLENPEFGAPQARQLARGASPLGLLLLSQHPRWSRDQEVRRRLLRNAVLPNQAASGLLRARSPHELFLLGRNRDLPERVRSLARLQLRAAYTRAPAELKVELIVKSEGRCLEALAGCGWDPLTVRLLCQRPLHSMQLAENLARSPSVPRPVIEALLRSPTVRRNPGLQNRLRRHAGSRRGTR